MQHGDKGQVIALPSGNVSGVVVKDSTGTPKTLTLGKNYTLDEFAEELDKYPRLTALSALGVGLVLGVVIGRRLR